MDLNSRQSLTSTAGSTDTLSIGNMTLKDLEQKGTASVADILSATAKHISNIAPSSRRNSLLQRCNDSKTHQQLDEVLVKFFHPLHVSTLPSVITYLMLNYFLLKKDHEENLIAKKLYEEHIALLKEKNSEMEERVRERADSKVVSFDAQWCKSCDDLRRSKDALSVQYARLKDSYDEICHINEQWALDYGSLAKQIANATGFHSVANSSSTISTASQATNSNYAPTSACVRCSIYETQLEDNQQETEDLRAMIVGLREDVKEYKERLNSKQRELSSLDNEYQIMRLQMQELGDLQQTLNMKQDYRKMQHSLQHKNKQYQDAMCEKLELQKQVEKLRQSFLKFFPTPNPPQQNTALPTSRPLSGGFYSFPLHSCRHNIQSHSVDPSPPTPPGLLARGDLRGAHVEKDEHPLPAIRLDENQSANSNHIYPHVSNVRGILPGQKPVMYHMTPEACHMTTGGSSNGTSSNSDHRLRCASELVANPNSSSPRVRGALVMSQSRISHSHSSDHMFHSKNPVSSLSPNTTASSYSNSSVPYSSRSSSSLGYVSDDPLGGNSPLMHSAPNLTHLYPPNGSRTGNSGMEYNSNRTYVDKKSLLLHGGATDQSRGRSADRPTSLGLLVEGAEGPGGATRSNQKFFVCPNCKKTFSYAHEAFEPWFEHIKFCGA